MLLSLCFSKEPEFASRVQGMNIGADKLLGMQTPSLSFLRFGFILYFRLALCSLGWPQTCCNLPASASLMLGLEACDSIPRTRNAVSALNC